MPGSTRSRSSRCGRWICISVSNVINPVEGRVLDLKKGFQSKEIAGKQVLRSYSGAGNLNRCCGEIIIVGVSWCLNLISVLSTFYLKSSPVILANEGVCTTMYFFSLL